MGIKAILWDVDGTLLDFVAAEKNAIRDCFAAFGLGECTDEMLAEYSLINAGYWRRMERGELTKQQVLEGRFVEFFSGHGLDTGCVAAFNERYQVSLGDTVVFYPGALETVRALCGRVKQYAVTNGTKVAQQRKLAASGLDALLDGVFISEDIGIEKPNIGFFEAVWAQTGEFAPDEVMIVGDSLTSDMKGGSNAGIICCWFNPKGVPVPEDICIHHEIKCLDEVLALCPCCEPGETLIVDLDGCDSLREMHLRLKEIFCLPEYYGRNLDALYDCLREKYAAYTAPLRLCLRGTQTAAEPVLRKLPALLRLFRELCEKYPNISVEIES